jgi:DNA-binding LacI/PurR family transcriptional regulator
VIDFSSIPDAAPRLTTIAQPIVEKGRRAARLIFEPGPPRTEILPVKLVKRASTARVNPGTSAGRYIDRT